MPGLRTTIDFQELRDATKAFQARGGNLQGVSEVIALDLVTDVEKRFETESGHVQGPWKKHAPSTIARMRGRRRRSNYKLLQDRGILVASILPYHDGIVAEAYTNVPYAKYHISRAPRSKIPLRDFFDIDFELIMENTADLLLAEISESSA